MRRRLKHKQELAALRSETQKLLAESKSGQKGKELSQKELEAARKKLTDTETRLKAVLQEKQTAVQDKANLERQLKQLKSQVRVPSICVTSILTDGRLCKIMFCHHVQVKAEQVTRNLPEIFSACYTSPIPDMCDGNGALIDA